MGVKPRKPSNKYQIREGVMYIPDVARPSGFREYCTTKAAWDHRREELAARANEKCEKCSRFLPYPTGDGSHLKSTGSGGDDSMDNLQWLCLFCHRILVHNPKAVPRKSDGR